MSFFRRAYISVQQRLLFAWQFVYFILLHKRKHIVVFLIPGFEVRKGGILSIYSFYYETKALLAGKSTVLMMSYPNNGRIWRYKWFKNTVNILPFNLLISNKYRGRDLIVHVPEYYADKLYDSLTDKQVKILNRFNNLHINIMNQNIEVMPTPEAVQNLKGLSSKFSCTVAHEKYATKSHRDYYGWPVHMLSSWFDKQEITVHNYEYKEDIMIVSPDSHPAKDTILRKINDAFPHLQMVVIENMNYEDYKRLEAKAKWSITFGEGFDGYLVGPVLRGGIGFAIYNEEFFMPEYLNLPNVFESYDVFDKEVIKFINENNNKKYYENKSEIARKVFSEKISYKLFKHNVNLFYAQHYTHP